MGHLVFLKPLYQVSRNIGRIFGRMSGQKINAGHRTMSGNNDPMSGRNIFLLYSPAEKCCSTEQVSPLFGRNFLCVNNFVFICPLLVHMTSKWKIERDFRVIYTGLLVTLEGGGYIDVKNVREKSKPPGHHVRR